MLIDHDVAYSLINGGNFFAIIGVKSISKGYPATLSYTSPA